MGVVSVHLCGQLLLVYILLKDPCSPHRVDLDRTGKDKKNKSKIRYEEIINMLYINSDLSALALSSVSV